MTRDPEIKVELYKDLIFRAIFGKETSKDFLKDLLNAVMEQAELPQIAELKLKNPFNLSVAYGLKSTIMDIHAVDETGRHFDIEMQLRYEDVFSERLFYYGAGLYGNSLEQGESYSQAPPVVCVAFVNFPLSVDKPDVWFDKWQMRSTLGTGLGTDKITNVFVRLPRVFEEEASPTNKFTEQLDYWVKILSSYSQLTKKEKLELSDKTKGFDQLERQIRSYFRTEEGQMVFSLQRDMEAWAKDLVGSQERLYERERQARIVAEREREEAEREREEEKQRSLESQRKGVVRAFRWKFGADKELPENWAEGLTYDELETLADKIFECATLEEALDLLRSLH